MSRWHSWTVRCHSRDPKSKKPKRLVHVLHEQPYSYSRLIICQCSLSTAHGETYSLQHAELETALRCPFYAQA